MLIEALRARLGDRTAQSFRLMGEDLQLLTVADVLAVLERCDDPALVAEEAALASEAHQWLRKYNRSMHGRVAGYLELGRRCDFRYPWPVVAILGIVQVMTGMDRARLYGLAGRVASRLGYKFFEQLGDASEDILRRTNRGIFADSVPTVLRALRVVELRRAGNTALADALVDGRGALLWDDECTELCTLIADGIAANDFTALARTTLRHFDREQAIFSHHISSKSRRRRLPAAKSVPAPVVARGKLVFKPFVLPEGFDLRDHDARVAAFGRAFVTSVTGGAGDYEIARDWVLARFG